MTKQRDEEETRRDPAGPGPQAPKPSSTGLQRGDSVGRYLVLARVGEGGMGVVYAAYDPELDRKVAIKLLRATRSEDAAQDQARLLREAQAMARVSHPNVIAVHDVGTYRDQVFVAMELVEGWNLRTWLEQPRSWREVMEVMRAAGRGLAAAHAAGLAHRDFKPDNILVGHDGRVRVTDFGLARLVAVDTAAPPVEAEPASRVSPAQLHLSSSITQEGTVVGTPAYMAPEQHLGLPPDARSDQFSYCATLYYALYRRRAFDPRQLAALAKDLPEGDPTRRERTPSGARSPAPRALALDFPRMPRHPRWLRRTLVRGLALSPERRFASMEALLAALSPSPVSTPQAAVAVVLLLLLAGALASQWTGSREAPCEDPQRRLAGVWDAAARARVTAAFAGANRPYATAALQRVLPVLDRYAAAWTDMEGESCRATKVQRIQSEAVGALRGACLDQRLKALETMAQLLAQADVQVVEKAVEAAGTLPAIADCADVEVLSGPVLLPESPTARAELARLGVELARARVLRSAGQYQEALRLVGEIVTSARPLAYAPLLADALCEQGWNLVQSGDSRSAVTVLLQAWRQADEGRHDEARVIAATGLIYAWGNDQARPDAASLWGELGESALIRLRGRPELEIGFRQQLSVALIYQGEYLKARHQLERALALCEQTQGERHPARPMLLTILGSAEQELGDKARARQVLEEAVAANERLGGREHPQAAYAHNNLAVFYSDEGDYARAYAHAHQAREVALASLGAEHPLMAAILDTQATILNRQGRHPEALEKSRESLAMFGKVISPEHPDLAFTLDNLGYALMSTGRPREALPHLEKALGLSPSDRRRTADLHLHLAQALVMTGGDQARARALAEKARSDYLLMNRRAEASAAEALLAILAR